MSLYSRWKERWEEEKSECVVMVVDKISIAPKRIVRMELTHDCDVYSM